MCRAVALVVFVSGRAVALVVCVVNVPRMAVQVASILHMRRHVHFVCAMWVILVANAFHVFFLADTRGTDPDSKLRLRVARATAGATHYVLVRLRESRLSYVLHSLCACVVCAWSAKFDTDTTLIITAIFVLAGIVFSEKSAAHAASDREQAAKEAKAASDAVIAAASRAIQLHATAFDVAGKGIIITNEKQVVLHVNKTWCSITGYSVAEAVGKEGGSKFLQGPKTDAVACARMGAAVRAGQKYSGTVLNYKKDGSSFWNEITIVPVRICDRIEQFIGTVDDVTDKIELEEANRRAETARHRAEIARKRAETAALVTRERAAAERDTSAYLVRVGDISSFFLRL